MALFRTAERARLCAVLGFAIAFLAPVISQIVGQASPGWCARTSSPTTAFSGFFPWGAYLAFGVAAGSAIRLIPPAMDRAMQW